VTITVTLGPDQGLLHILLGHYYYYSYYSTTAPAKIIGPSSTKPQLGHCQTVLR